MGSIKPIAIHGIKRGSKKMNKKLYEKIQEVCEYFEYHNKNLTKKQECLIIELKEIFEEAKNNDKK